MSKSNLGRIKMGQQHDPSLNEPSKKKKRSGSVVQNRLGSTTEGSWRTPEPIIRSETPGHQRMTCSGADKINPVSAPLRADVPLHSFLPGRGALGFEKAPPPAHGARGADFGVGQSLSPLLSFFYDSKRPWCGIVGRPKIPLISLTYFWKRPKLLTVRIWSGSGSFNFTNLQCCFIPCFPARA